MKLDEQLRSFEIMTGHELWKSIFKSSLKVLLLHYWWLAIIVSIAMYYESS